VSGNAWPHPELVTISFEPDGTSLNGYASNLFSAFNLKFGSTAAWQNVFLKAAQFWAQQTNLNFDVVTDNKGATGSGSYQQGDPGMGDIRIGGYNFNNPTLAQAYMPPPVNNFSIAGDVLFNTGQNFNNGCTYDLFSVAVHEIGHALGLYHSSVASSVLYSAYNGVKYNLDPDDVGGIRAIYSGGAARAQDRFDRAQSNGTLAAATDLTSAINGSSLTAVVTGLDVTTAADQDYYTFTAPAGSSGSFTVAVQSKDLSLLAPALTVYDANGNVLSSASGAGQYGATLARTVTGVTAGTKYYVKVAGADVSAFGTGAYALTLNFGTGPSLVVPLPNTQTLNGSPRQGGGGQASKVDEETLVNTYSAGAQQTDFLSPHSVAMDPLGNYVVVWTSAGQDGSGSGVYAQRYDMNGNPQGREFRVNTTTSGNQSNATVAMDALGDYVVTWQSQDASGTGIYARRFTPLGLLQGGEFRVNTTTAGDQRYPKAAMDALGNFVITWQSQGEDGSGWGVYARWYTTLGLPLGGGFRVNTTTAGDQQFASVAMDKLGNFVVAWQSQGQDGGGSGVYARQFGPLGLPLGGEFRVNTTTAGDQLYPTVAGDTLGNYVITWTSTGQDGSGAGVYARRYSLLGIPLGGEIRVNTTTANDQAYPSVAMDTTGNFFVTWSSYGQDGSGWGVYGRQFSALGTALGDEFAIHTTTAGDQKAATAAMDSLGHVVVVWSGNGPGDADGVFSQRFSVLLQDESSDVFDPNELPAEPGAAAPTAGPAAPPAPPPAALPAMTHPAAFLVWRTADFSPGGNLPGPLSALPSGNTVESAEDALGGSLRWDRAVEAYFRGRGRTEVAVESGGGDSWAADPDAADAEAVRDRGPGRDEWDDPR
jgi:hypothetical protein